MASDITLSKGVRQNLLSLQGVADLLNRTQERLATGKKVNSALDNPINFFTSSGLTSRANDLGRLLDSVGNAIQTLQAADKGISSITKLLESAQATANQAKTTAGPATTYALNLAGNVNIGTDVAAAHTGSVDVSTPVDLGATYDTDTVTVTVNGTATTLTINTTTLSDSDELVAAIDGISGIAASVDGGTGFIEITADNNATTFELAFSDAGIGTDLGLTAGTYAPTNAVLGALNTTISVQVGSGPTYVLNFANATANEITNRAELEDRITDINADLTDVALDVDNTTGFLEVNSTSSESITVTNATAALGLAAGTSAPTATVTDSAARTSLQADFNALLTQVTQLAGDASFNGINLLDSDNLTVVFNEDGSSSLTITGVDFSSSGLSLTTVIGTGFQSDTNIDAALDELEAATTTLRTQASKFGSNLSIVQTRQDFTKNLISVLQIGADNLVLADTNEEGANMLALNTRQQLSTVALSLAAQADQNVLQLF
ncbi:MAG TPA: flagellin [Xanthobacteraceae bacterium]|jgi:flagellin-like hook-associated protein FlgL